MANKINEIIGVINNGEVDEELSARVDNLEDNLNSFEEQTNQIVSNLENWVVVSDESDIFDTVNGEKYFKHDTYLYFNHLSSEIRGYFIKGFPKKKVKISSQFIDSSASENLSFELEYLTVTNDDRFQIRDTSLIFNFDETPIKSQDVTERRYPEYATSYDDTGQYGKLVMLVRNTGS